MRASGGFSYLWRFDVRPGRETPFERLYGPDGGWSRFFARSPAYRGTDLLRSPGGGTYLTVDRWDSEEEYQDFVAANVGEWEALDREGQGLTVREEPLGEFEVVAGSR